MKTDREESTLSFESSWKTAPKQSSNAQYLNVDDTKRFRATSDPGSLHICIVPEITITGEDGRSSDCTEDDEFDSNFIPPPPRPRANTCPEEMFRARKERPPTPPPEDVHNFRHPTGKRFSFNFSPKDINGLSFALHKLSKVSEEINEQQKNNEFQALEPSVRAQTSACSCSPDITQAGVYCSDHTDSEVSRLNSCAVLEKSSTENTSDSCISKQTTSASVTEYNNITNNNKEQVTSINSEEGMSSCSPTTYRSIEDNRDSIENDHLVVY